MVLALWHKYVNRVVILYGILDSFTALHHDDVVPEVGFDHGGDDGFIYG